MKSFKFLLFALFIGFAVHAQEYTTSLDGVNWVKIESRSKITVKTHSQNQLLIQPEKSFKIPEKAKGLKLVGDGVANTDIGFSVIKDGNNLLVKNLRNTDNGETVIYLPASQNISVKSSGLHNIEVSGFTGEIEANADVTGAITISDVTGPITAHTNTGKVEVIFNKVNQSSPISISTATGEVDVTLPAYTPADLSLNSTMGEIYTNFDLSLPDKNGLKAISTKKVVGSINDGGVKIQLNSATGNIYLRKK
tara:strand:- start:173169 stop:173921 length:753 start_codon:yes stop_codon:yes gene_type:complete